MHLCSLRAERVEAAGLNQRFDRRPAGGASLDTLAEVEQVAEWPTQLAGSHDRFARTAATSLDRRQAEVDLASGDREIDSRAVHVGRHDVDPHPLAIFQVLDEC